jgi:hypothetical protein
MAGWLHTGVGCWIEKHKGPCASVVSVIEIHEQNAGICSSWCLCLCVSVGVVEEHLTFHSSAIDRSAG